MLVRSSIKGIIGYVADSVLLGRDSNRDPDRYRANSIDDSNDNNYYNNVDGFNNLGMALYLIFSDVAQNAANFKTNLSLLIIY